MIINNYKLIIINNNYKYILINYAASNIPVAAPNKVWGCCPSLTGIAGSNPTKVMDFFCECCQVELSASG
jgi:hypothetical protein